MKQFPVLSSLAIALTLISSVSLAGDNTETASVASLIELFRTGDQKAISQRVDYPLTRARPVPPIANERDFIERFDEVFDPDFVEAIVSSDPEEDWESMGYQGTMLYRGVMWLDTDGNITAVLHQSAAEQAMKADLIKAQKAALHPSINQFEAPILEWETDTFRVRIDEIGEGRYRYASWSIDKSTADKPDLILTDGERIYEGSGGNHHYNFKNGQYLYRCDVFVIGHSDSPPGWLEVYKAGRRLLTEDVRAVR